MNATAVAAALGARAEEVCRRYLPHGRKNGRYWTAGDVRGARGRSLFVRLAPPGVPGKWTDAATGEHGDLLDLIRIASGAASLRAALAEARAFLSLPPATVAAASDTYDRMEAARRLWQRCRAIDGTHAEAYLHARAIHRCRFPALRFHPALFYRDGGAMRRLPALVAAVTGAGGTVTGVHRTWLDPSRPAKAPVARPRKALGRVHGLAVRFGNPAPATLLVGEGIETVLSLVTAMHHLRQRLFALQRCSDADRVTSGLERPRSRIRLIPMGFPPLNANSVDYGRHSLQSCSHLRAITLAPVSVPPLDFRLDTRGPRTPLRAHCGSGWHKYCSAVSCGIQLTSDRSPPDRRV